MPVTLVWFRHDLRLADHAPLRAAVKRGAVVPVFLWSPEEYGDWPPGGAAKVYLHYALQSLDESLRNIGSRLIVRRGAAAEHLKQIAETTGADAVYAHRLYEPALARRDDKLEARLALDGIDLKLYDGYLLHDPEQIATGSGDPYKVFSPFWKKFCKQIEVGKPLPAPRKLDGPGNWPHTSSVGDLGLLPQRDWDQPIADAWPTSEADVTRRMKWFVGRADDYGRLRDRPDGDHTSRLSPALRFGLLSPRSIWRAVAEGMARDADWKTDGRAAYLREVGWREFAYHLLHHFPHTPGQPLYSKFDGFPWHGDDEKLRAWQRGRTGYPIVDAGIRQLWRTGWMHNRVRMIAASFLTKDLLIDWRAGAAWFWDTLVDADLANNTLGWQWAAGCGADAQPFFRIFNPHSQAAKFDPNGDYARQWIPELETGDYPEPIVDHARVRQTALEAYEKIRNA